ncbi:hypothetical protein, partial [Cupriavidus sp.]
DATNPGFEGEQESQQNQRSTNTTPAPVLGLRTASYCTENEGTPGTALKRFGESDAERCEAVLATVNDRIEQEWQEGELQLGHLPEVLGGWACELYVHDGRASAGQWLQEWSGKPLRYQSLLTSFLSMLRGLLFQRYQNEPTDKQLEVTDRAQKSVARILERALTVAAEDHATYVSAADASVKEAVVPRYKAASIVISHAMNQFYFGSGAYQGVEGQEREPIGLATTTAKTRFLQDYAQILNGFARSTEPETLHHLIELYEFLIPGDPVRVFDSVHEILLGSGRTSGYQFEDLGSAAVVKVVTRYIADHRSIFDDESRRARLVAVLRLFSEAGWPDALRLLYDLPELLR